MAETAEPVDGGHGTGCPRREMHVLARPDRDDHRPARRARPGAPAEHGLTLAEYEVLAIISDAGDDGLRMQELAETLHLSPSGVTRRVDGMVRQGLVVRRQCSDDRRGSYAMLTDDGWNRLREAAPTHVRGVRTHFVDRLSERQLANVAERVVVGVDRSRGRRGRLRRGVVATTLTRRVDFSGARGRCRATNRRTRAARAVRG